MEKGGVAAETLQDILTRFERKVASAGDDNNRAGQGANKPRLLPDRHPVRDFFIADLLDWALKDDRASMEHPFFSLSKTPDKTTQRYERNGVTVIITASAEYGRATIWDKDILIYAVSQLVEAINQGRPVNRVVHIKAYDLLVATNRHTGGENYKRLVAALNRLAGTRVQTNIITNGKRRREGFGLLDNWRVIEKSQRGDWIATVELTLNEWLFDAVVAKEVLTLNRDYFRLDGGLERRLYELARKHCGHQSQWKIGMELLHTKSGSTAPLKEFRRKVKGLVDGDDLLDYRLQYDADTDQVLFYTTDAKKLAQSLTNT
jgi:plasmid replication initiation protein